MKIRGADNSELMQVSKIERKGDTLVLKGKVKKVIALSSGHGDLDLINDLDIENAALYAASKAALNVVVAKFSARYKRDGVLFVSISPGVVAVDHGESGGM